MEKLVAGILGLWLLCGAATAFATADQRPMDAKEFLLAPIRLAQSLG